MCKSSCAADSNYDSLITRDGFTRDAHENYTSVDAMLLVLIRHGSRDTKKNVQDWETTKFDSNSFLQ